MKKNLADLNLADLITGVVTLSIGGYILSQIGNPFYILNDIKEEDLINNATGIIMQILGEQYEKIF